MSKLEEVMRALGDNRLGHLSEWVESLVEENEKLKLDAGGHYIRGGQGSHWVGCEEAHYDCKISKLEKENEKLSKQLVECETAITKYISKYGEIE